MSYSKHYQSWRDDPEGFWLSQAKQLAWNKPPSIGSSVDSDGISHWFADGTLNTCFLALDYHVATGRGQQTALIYDSPVTGIQTTYTYERLLEETACAAGMLSDLGVGKGDTVIIYMPMIPEAAITMLACARIGAIHSVVFGGFAPPELASRIDDARPKVIVSASCGIEVNRVIEYKPMIDQAMALAEHKPETVVVKQREMFQAALDQTYDKDWSELIARAKPVDPVPVAGSDPLYILYTSGTTGKPKGVVREAGGHAVALNYSMQTIYGMQPGDVFWSASDVGWVVGHSYIVYGPLIKGCTTVLYEGKPIGTPDAGTFWRVISQYGVNALFSAPTAFRAIRREDPQAELMAQHDISSLRTVFAAGERLDPATQNWMAENIGVPIIDNWWQTETGWPIVSNMMGIDPLKVKPGSATKPIPGFDVRVVDEQGRELASPEQGNIAIKLPLPPGCLTSVWGDHQRYIDAYLSEYPGFYSSGDGGYFDEDGYLFVMGRIDDVINVAGHRLSTGDIEEVIARHSDVAECAVVAQSDDLKGEIPVGFVVTNAHCSADSVPSDLVQDVRAGIGPIACFKKVHIVPRLPKTRSGKVLRKTLKAMVNGETVSVPPTIDDPVALDEISDLLKN